MMKIQNEHLSYMEVFGSINDSTQAWIQVLYKLSDIMNIRGDHGFTRYY